MTVSGQSDGHLRQFDDGIVARDDDDFQRRKQYRRRLDPD
jgi:hypothetical protein